MFGWCSIETLLHHMLYAKVCKISSFAPQSATRRTFVSPAFFTFSTQKSTFSPDTPIISSFPISVNTALRKTLTYPTTLERHTLTHRRV